MKDISKHLKESLSESDGFGHSTPSQMPNMGDAQSGDIASDVGDTFDPNFKKGTDIPSNGKKKNDEEE